jgi:hypothetical protein
VALGEVWEWRAGRSRTQPVPVSGSATWNEIASWQIPPFSFEEDAETGQTSRCAGFHGPSWNAENFGDLCFG